MVYNGRINCREQKNHHHRVERTRFSSLTRTGCLLHFSNLHAVSFSGKQTSVWAYCLSGMVNFQSRTSPSREFLFGRRNATHRDYFVVEWIQRFVEFPHSWGFLLISRFVVPWRLYGLVIKSLFPINRSGSDVAVFSQKHQGPISLSC